MQTKICTKCNEELPSNADYFYRRKALEDGLDRKCKVCTNIVKQAWRDKNKENTKVLNQKYYENNKEAILERNRVYHEANKEKIDEQKAQYRIDNRDILLAKKRAASKVYYYENIDKLRQYRLDNKDTVKQYNDKYYKQHRSRIIEEVKIYAENNQEYIKAYKKANRSKYNKHGQIRRAKAKLLPYTLTTEQYLSILNDFNNQCAYCGMSQKKHIKINGQILHQDHFIALSKGGGYTHNNIVPSCRSCNASKRNNDFFEWYPQYEYYDKDRESFILNYLGYENKIQQLALF